MKKTTLLVALAVTLFSCKESVKKEEVAKEAKQSQFNKAEWLLGNWGSSTPDGELTENWNKVNDSVYNGESYIIAGKDTLFAETMLLDEVSGKMAFTVSVPHQNDEKPVRFDMTSITDKEIVFENPKHDFPDKIIYTNVTTDSLVAVIYGTKKGTAASETFKMKRLP